MSSFAWYWYADQHAAAARQSSLDLLWMEQTINNKLETNKDMLQNWSEDLQANNSTARVEFLRRIDSLIKENRAILAIDYLDSSGHRLLGLPLYEQRPNHLPPLSDPLITEVISKAHGLEQASYSRVIEQFAPLWVLAMPLFSENRSSGSILVTYDLDKLLTQEVPWWFVQRYDLTLVDQNDKQLSPSDGGIIEHQQEVNRLDFGASNSNLSLKTSVRETKLSRVFLISLALAILVFGMTIVWLLSILKRWLRERQIAQQALRERDELLQHTARLSSLAEFASGIAHELNQPLSAIANYSAAVESFVQSEKLQLDKIHRAVKKIGEESRRAGKIMHNMRNFIHKNAQPHELHSLITLVNEAIDLVEAPAKRQRIKLTFLHEQADILLECDAVMLKQVFFNLLRNAIEATPLLVARENPMIVPQIECQIHTDADNVILSIRDHGQGIADTDKLFKAFYTTKPEGMGLGLAICRTVVESHGGKIWAENHSDGGALFQIKLPLTTFSRTADAEALQATTNSNTHPIPHHETTV